jgi:hypothetical protein
LALSSTLVAVHEYFESRMPSQPLKLVLGLVFGLAATIYGIVSLLS